MLDRKFKEIITRRTSDYTSRQGTCSIYSEVNADLIGSKIPRACIKIELPNDLQVKIEEVEAEEPYRKGITAVKIIAWGDSSLENTESEFIDKIEDVRLALSNASLLSEKLEEDFKQLKGIGE